MAVATSAESHTAISTSWSRLITTTVWRKGRAVRVSEAMGEESGERRTGGIVRRGVERQIDDRKLLERPGAPPEFLDSDPLPLRRLQAAFLAGLNGPTPLGTAPTLFWSSRSASPSPLFPAWPG